MQPTGPKARLLCRRQVNLAAPLPERLAHRRHASFRIGMRRALGKQRAIIVRGTSSATRREECVRRLVLRRCEVAHFLRDLHRAELWPAHRAEVGGLGAFCGEILVVIGERRLRIEREVELVPPPELEPGA